MKDNNEVDIFFLGDTYFGEWHMRLRARKGKYDVLKEKGYNHFGKNFELMLNEGDEVIANLECAITDMKKSPLVSTDKRHIYSAREDGTISALKTLNISTLMLANNHLLDYGKEGLFDTINALEKNGFNYFGAGEDSEEAMQAHKFEKEIDGKTFKTAIFSSYNYTNRSDKWGFYAKEHISGVNALDERKIAKQISALKAQDDELFFIASPHWGPNYAWRSNSQQMMGQELVKAGINLIVGHSAHMIQEVEYYKETLIVNSIGNFLFNGDGEYKKRNLPPYSFIARLNVKNINNNLEKRMILYPFLVANKEIDFTPALVGKEAFEHVATILRSHNYDPKEADKYMKMGRDKHGYYFEYRV